MRLTTSKLFYGTTVSPFDLPAEWHHFEDRSDIDLDALAEAMALATNNALHAHVFRNRSTLKHVDAVDVKAEGKHCYMAPRTVVMGSGFMVVWTHGEESDFVRDIEAA